MKNEEKIKGETLFEGKIIKVQKDIVKIDGKVEAQREVVRHKGGCCAVAVDDDQNILMVKQIRYPYLEVVEEIPAGKLDVKGESPLDAAKRELLEETGYKAKRWKELGIVYPTPGYCDEKLYIYAATSLKKVAEQSLDEGEFLDFYKVPLKEAVDNAVSGVYKDAKTVVGILRYYYLNKKEGK